MKNKTVRPASGQARWSRDETATLKGWWLIGDRVRKWQDYDAHEENPEVYMAFANLPVGKTARERDAIQRFVSRYGFLTTTMHEVDGEFELGDSLRAWCREILSIRRTLHVLQLVKSKSRVGLRAAFAWDQHGVSIVDQDNIKTWIGRSKLFVDGLGRPKAIPTAIWALTQWINTGLEGRISGGVVPESTSQCEFSFALATSGIGGAVWAQLAMTSTRSIQCANCGIFFTPRRTTAKFCSTGRCRQEHHEKTRKEAS